MKQILTIAGFIIFFGACSKNEAHSERQETESKFSESTDKGADETATKEDLIGGLFDLGSALVKSADEVGQELFQLTEKEQKDIGERLHKKLKSEHKFQEGSRQLERIKKLSMPFKAILSRKDLALKFSIIEADEVNAFSHVGGYIYFNTGLLEIISTDAELQFVVGHEIAHLELGHCEKLLTYAVRAEGLGNELGGALGAESAGTIASLAYRALSSGYSEDQELACDAWAYRAMRKSGMTHIDCCAMSRKFLEREDKAEDPGNKSGDPIDKLHSELDAHFRTHPHAKKRLNALEQLK
jgi:putative metalloprotease